METIQRSPLINIIHLAVIVPLFFYIGSQGVNNPTWVFPVLGLIGLSVIIYHFYRFYTTGSWINLIHLLIGAFLLYAYSMGSTLSSGFYTIFTLGSIVMAIVHSYLLYQKM